MAKNNQVQSVFLLTSRYQNEHPNQFELVPHPQSKDQKMPDTAGKYNLGKSEGQMVHPGLRMCE